MPSPFSLCRRRFALLLSVLGLAPLLLAMAMPGLAAAQGIAVGDVAGFEAALKQAGPGAVIELESGIWKDVHLRVAASGSKDQPLTIRARQAGKVVLVGDSRLQVGGEHVVVEGLRFEQPCGEEAIELRLDSKHIAKDCRITQCAVVGSGGRSQTARMLSLYGRGHRVDHCYFAQKTSAGTSLVVWLGSAEQAWGGHRLDHNHFGPRQPLGKNGGETIRVGDSKTSLQAARCRIEHNLFERCNGEAECISNKSCGNVYFRNRFLEVSGTLTLRHGNGCEVLENAFLGGKARHCGGVRVVGEDHLVRGNHMEDLSGDKERSAICLMNGIKNGPLNGYAPVRRLRLEDNGVLRCKSPLQWGMSGHQQAVVAPAEVSVVNLRISSAAPKDEPQREGVHWQQKDLRRPQWLSQAEPAGPSWRTDAP